MSFTWRKAIKKSKEKLSIKLNTNTKSSSKEKPLILMMICWLKTWGMDSWMTTILKSFKNSHVKNFNFCKISNPWKMFICCLLVANRLKIQCFRRKVNLTSKARYSHLILLKNKIIVWKKFPDSNKGNLSQKSLKIL